MLILFAYNAYSAEGGALDIKGTHPDSIEKLLIATADNIKKYNCAHIFNSATGVLIPLKGDI